MSQPDTLDQTEPSTLPTSPTALLALAHQPLEAYLAFLRKEAALEQEREVNELIAEWQQARQHLAALPPPEPGEASSPLEPEQEALAAHVRQDPAFQSLFGLGQARVRWLCLNRLVSFQSHILLHHAQRFSELLGGGHPALETLFELALPKAPTPQAVESQRLDEHTYLFTARALDFRLLATPVLTPQEVRHQPGGQVLAALAVLLGTGADYLSAIEYQGHTLLLNGYHRAYALLQAGLTQAPGVVQRLSTPEELGLVLGAASAQQVLESLQRPRPPLLRDFLNPALTRRVRLRPKVKQIRVSLRVEQYEVALPE
ncbi:MAG: hypothetical protein N2318_02130 [Meiothermus sp.]|nr:hypothetical protein [Meiothermus sp.]